MPAPNGATAIHVVSYDIDEMLGTKLRALVQREHGRDLYDLWKAIDTNQKTGAPAKVNPARVGEAFRFYLKQEGSVFSAADVRRSLDDRMQTKKFLRDMDGYLPPGATYDAQIAHKMFCEVLQPHLDANQAG